MLGFTVWAHHMFTSGMAAWIRIPMAITTAIIAVPTGIKIFSWLATLWRGVLHLDTPMLFALGFLTTFTLGGISGVMLAMVPFDIHVSATYFIVAHIHYVLFGGSLMTIFAGVYYWFPKMTGRMYDERLGKWHFWTTFIFFNATFGPMHMLGLQGMPRRVATYAAQFADLNLLISIMSFGLGFSTLIFVYNMVTSWRGGPRAESQPVAGHDARVAGHLATAGLQLRPCAHRRRRPIRVRGPRSRPWHLHAPTPAGAAGGSGDRAGTKPNDGEETGMKEILVVANRTLGGDKLLEAVRERAGRRARPLPPGRAPEQALGRAGDLRRGGPRIGPGARRPGALGGGRRGDRGDRRSRRRGSVPGDDGRGRRTPARRDHHLHPPRHPAPGGCDEI